MLRHLMQITHTTTVTVVLVVTSTVCTAATATQATCPPNLLDEYCNSPALSLCPQPSNPPLIPLRSGCAISDNPEWRCYNAKCLNANHTAYLKGSNCTAYCTRDTQMKQILASCKLPPAPPPPVYANATEVFTPGELGYPCIRIPSISLAGDNMTLNAFAECRNWTGDGCYPTSGPPSQGENRDICMKSSVDAGKTWSPLRVIARNGAQGSPVYDFRTQQLVLQYKQLVPSDTMQMVSHDHGATWSTPISVCGNRTGTLPTSDCGGAVGPGVGIQLHQGPHRGRLLYIGHYGAYGHDTVWYSDDNGQTWAVGQGNFSKMDEAQLVELPNGDVMANMRTNHLNSTCKCRAVARSHDGGATWGPVGFDPVLTSPVCMGSILRSGNEVFFANPASTTSRANGTLRRSNDGDTWMSSTVVWPGAYAYSCLTEMPQRQTVGVLWETDGPQCKIGSASCRTVFSVFPTTF
eukprot:m.198036 g.198036  ORF g.198036 m.198036 type:complete len:464 (-) comp20324_c0_seq1:39-1430(-)